MDNYIEQLLGQPVFQTSEGDLEKLRRRLEEIHSSVAAGEVEQTAESTPAEHSASAGSGPPEEEPPESGGYLQEIQQALRDGEYMVFRPAAGQQREIGWLKERMKMVERAETFRSWQTNSGRGSITTLEPAKSTGQMEYGETSGKTEGMSPEALSMFFQRDARRYG